MRFQPRLFTLSLCFVFFRSFSFLFSFFKSHFFFSFLSFFLPFLLSFFRFPLFGRLFVRVCVRVCVCLSFFFFFFSFIRPFLFVFSSVPPYRVSFAEHCSRIKETDSTWEPDKGKSLSNFARQCPLTRQRISIVHHRRNIARAPFAGMPASRLFPRRDGSTFVGGRDDPWDGEENETGNNDLVV